MTSTSREDFKKAIRAGNVSEAFLVAMSNAPELNITTKIISAEGEHHQANGNQSQEDNYLHTHINLIEGKIENEIGEKLTGDRYSEIKQFHIQQVTQGHQTIQHNLISLQKMFQLMSAFQQQQQNAGHPNWVDIAADVARESLPAKPKTNQLFGNKTPDALKAGETDNITKAVSSGFNEFNSDPEADKPEPQLPSFDSEAEEEDRIVDDLLSLADIDENESEEENQPQEKQTDWGEWLEDEPEVNTEVFDLKSLNIREAAQNWQSWDSSDHSPDSQPPTTEQ